MKDFDVKAFGKNVPPRPLNPNNKESHIYANTTKLNGQDVPRLVSLERKLLVILVPLLKLLTRIVLIILDILL